MIDLFKKHVPWRWLVYIIPSFLSLAPDSLKTQDMCNEAVRTDPWLLYDVSDYLKTQEMCNEAIEKSTMDAVQCITSFQEPEKEYKIFTPPEIYYSRLS